MRSSSLKLLLDSRIEHPREYRDRLIHEWYLKKEDTEFLEVFIMQYYSIEVFLAKVIDDEIRLGTKKYQIIWVHRPQTVKKSGTAVISFRYCNLLDCGYALIKKYDMGK